MRDIRANSKGELLSILKVIDIRVPARNKGRKKGHCESWSIFRLLATLAKHNAIYFPIQLTKRERPDFLLKTADKYIGVEVTEAINPEYAKAATLPEANTEAAIIDPSLFKWGTPRRKLDELRLIVFQKKLNGPGWEGNSVETEYANAILNVMMSKTEKLRALGFDKFTENWLVIYCNITLPALNLDEANLLFAKKAMNYWSINSFSRVFVERGTIIISYSRDCMEIMDLENIWNRS